LIVAVIALVVAMSGTAAAASLITGKQIKNGTIQTQDISKTARAKLAGKAEPAGAKGDPGPPGAPGAAGALGQDGRDVTNLVVRRGEAGVPGHQTGIAFAPCNPGEKAGDRADAHRIRDLRLVTMAPGRGGLPPRPR
jgi:hypothetical protein